MSEPSNAPLGRDNRSIVAVKDRGFSRSLGFEIRLLPVTGIEHPVIAGFSVLGKVRSKPFECESGDVFYADDSA